MRVSEKHYLQVPDGLYDEVAKSEEKRAAESAAFEAPALQKALQQTGAPTRKASQAKDITSCGCETSRTIATSGARTRTGDLGIMKPAL